MVVTVTVTASTYARKANTEEWATRAFLRHLPPAGEPDGMETGCDGWVTLLLTAKFDSGSTRTDLFRFAGSRGRWTG
jgi:hypothetical protein